MERPPKSRPLLPRLSDRALARRHLVDGVERIALHDASTGALFLLAPSRWDVARHADGTRTVEQIARAASVGDAIPFVEAAEIVDELGAADLLDEGPRSSAPPLDLDEEQRGRTALALLRVEALPDYAFRCDGRGECCASYASLAVTERDLARARRVGLTLFPGRTEDDSVTPFSGASRSDLFAMGLVDGRCIERRDGGCDLHLRGGADAKPTACRTYPFTLVSDGEVVRASVVCECSCVFRSLAPGDTHEAEALPERMSSFSDETRVRRLDPQIALTAHTMASDAAVLRWTRSVLAAPDAENPVALCLDQAMTLGALAHRGSGHPDDAPKGGAREILLAALERFAARVEDGRASADAWRSPSDRTRVARGVVARAALAALAPGRLEILFESLARARDEMFFVRATLFGVLVGAPIVTALEAMAARLLVAREIGDAEGAGRHPIATVEMVHRGLTG